MKMLRPLLPIDQRACEGPFTEQGHRAAYSKVTKHVRRILGDSAHACPWFERRTDHRSPFPYVMQLEPVGRNGDPCADETVVVVGKHLSRCGLDFYHREPLPHRRMILTIEQASGQCTRLLMELTWCRFIRQGWYASGGRFVGVIESTKPPR